MKIVYCNSQYFAYAADTTVHNIVGKHISFSAWVKVEPGCAIPTTFISKGRVGEGYMLGISYENGYPWFYIGFEGNYAATYESDIRDGQWHHIAGTYDKDEWKLRVYFDEDYVEAGGPDLEMFEEPFDDVFKLGDDSGAYGILPGWICDVKVYVSSDGYWSAGEIAYQAAHPFDYSLAAGSITEYWMCNEGSGVTLNGSEGNDLTLSSADVWVEDSLPRRALVKALMQQMNQLDGGI